MVWLNEPEGLERLWRALSAGDDQSHKLWADDDLAAFAQTADLTFVTLDRSFIKRYPSVRVEVRAPRSPSTIIPRPDSAPRCALVIAVAGDVLPQGRPAAKNGDGP